MCKLSKVAIVLGSIIIFTAFNSSVACADVVFDNFGNTFHDSEGAPVIGPTSPNPPILGSNDLAFPFVVVAPATVESFRLTEVELPLVWNTYGPDSILIKIFSDNSGEPGVSLASAELNSVGASPNMQTALYDGTVHLLAGQTYWVVATGVLDSEHLWFGAEPVLSSDLLLYRDPNEGAWMGPLPNDRAVRVLGIPQAAVATEPAAWGEIKAVYR